MRILIPSACLLLVAACGAESDLSLAPGPSDDVVVAPVVDVPLDEVVIEIEAPAEPLEQFRDDWLPPVVGRITSGFGDRDGRFHDALDIASTRGNSVVAPADLRIRLNAYDRRAGRYIVADVVGEDYRLTFAHLSHVDVWEGQRVKKGEVIGTTGLSGSATGPHLHFRVERVVDGERVALDPLTVIRESRITAAADL